MQFQRSMTRNVRRSKAEESKRAHTIPALRVPKAFAWRVLFVQLQKALFNVLQKYAQIEFCAHFVLLLLRLLFSFTHRKYASSRCCYCCFWNFSLLLIAFYAAFATVLDTHMCHKITLPNRQANVSWRENRTSFLGSWAEQWVMCVWVTAAFVCLLFAHVCVCVS